MRLKNKEVWNVMEHKALSPTSSSIAAALHLRHVQAAVKNNFDFIDDSNAAAVIFLNSEQY